MSSAPGQVSGDPLSAVSVDDPSSKRRRWCEVSLVMFLAFSGSLIRAVAYFRAGSPAQTQFGNARWLDAGFHEIGILLLLTYILWRSGRTFRDIGFRWSFREAGMGVPLYAVAYFLYAIGGVSINLIYFAFAGHYPAHVGARQVFGHMPLLALPFHFLNPFFEELVVRAYLMTEIRELTGSVMIAAAVSLALQTSYHIYYGWAGMLSVGCMFIAFVAYFMIWGRAFPVVVAHGIADLTAYFFLR
jgi:membrane protease YdiL (CAAX protease family)